jgi:hypothetical protein
MIGGGVIGGMAAGVAADRYFQEYNFDGKLQRVPNEWRYIIEYALHSLKDRSGGAVSSKRQREITRNMLLKNAPDSLAFGLLLHRLGDTYAHSVIGNEAHMYQSSSSDSLRECITMASLGHARDVHDPDYPYMRQDLFYEYLKDLHDILKKKYDEVSVQCKSGKQLDITEITQLFKDIFSRLVLKKVSVAYTRGMAATYESDRDPDEVVKDFIAAIRKKSQDVLNIPLDAYEPENIKKQTLDEFLAEHPELKKTVDRQKMIDGIGAIYNDKELNY